MRVLHTLPMLVVLLLASTACAAPPFVGMRFLVSVNDTWDAGCIYTSPSGWVKPDIPKNQSQSFDIGNCDHGPLTYTVTSVGPSNYTVTVTFYSSVIEDASPPTCDIVFSGQYLPPPLVDAGDPATASVLPGCFTIDSREGYHMTYYWFHILEWLSADKAPVFKPRNQRRQRLSRTIAVA
jgi:hypothetical protein